MVKIYTCNFLLQYIQIVIFEVTFFLLINFSQSPLFYNMVHLLRIANCQIKLFWHILFLLNHQFRFTEKIHLTVRRLIYGSSVTINCRLASAYCIVGTIQIVQSSIRGYVTILRISACSYKIIKQLSCTFFSIFHFNELFLL